MSNNNSNNTRKNNGSSEKKVKSKRSAAAIARRSAKWATQKAAKQAESLAKQEEKDRKTASVLEMFPSILGIVGSQGFMPNIKRSTLASKTLSKQLKNTPLFQNADRATIYPGGKTMLNKYLQEKNWEEAMKILDQGVPKKILDAPIDSGESPLFYTFRQHQYDLFKKLLEKGANPNTIVSFDANKMPILHYVATDPAEEKQKISCINILLKKGADINAVDFVGYRVLDATISTKENGIAKVLIDAGADVETPTKNGFTAVLTAISTNNLPLFEYMMKHRKLDLNKESGPNQLSPLKVAVMNAKFIMLYHLVNSTEDIDLDKKDKKGNTALHYAVMAKDYRKIIFLKKSGASSTIKNKQGFTALELAIALIGDQRTYAASKMYATLYEE